MSGSFLQTVPKNMPDLQHGFAIAKGRIRYSKLIWEASATDVLLLRTALPTCLGPMFVESSGNASACSRNFESLWVSLFVLWFCVRVFACPQWS